MALLQLLFNGFFKLLMLIVKILLFPFLALVNPILNAFGFSTYAGSILSFIASALSYVNFFLDAFHVPRLAMNGLILICWTMFTWQVVIRAYALIIAIWGFARGVRDPRGHD